MRDPKPGVYGFFGPFRFLSNIHYVDVGEELRYPAMMNLKLFALQRTAGSRPVRTSLPQFHQCWLESRLISLAIFGILNRLNRPDPERCAARQA